LAKSKGLELVLLETYRTSPDDFSELLNKVKATKPDVLVAGSIRFEDLLAITRKLKELDLNIRMVSAVPYGLLPDYYKQLGKDAEFVYSGSFWDAALPYPGNQQFVAAYEKEFNHPPAVQSAGGYAGCQLLIDAIRQTGGLDSENLREALLTLKTTTVFGDFAVDKRGYQTAHKAVTIQWQDGKQVVVWPDEVATGRRDSRLQCGACDRADSCEGHRADELTGWGDACCGARVRKWHKADIRKQRWNVRFQRRS
jgi:branched-chain amino acid transport system substrate-binding protein